MSELSKWVFCGDSIVDGEHSRCGDPNHIMGHGFAFMAGSYLESSCLQKEIKSYNTAQSGINSLRLLWSWESRVLSINPDVLTLLVGINDTNTLLADDTTPWQRSNVSAEAFERNLRYMLYLAREKNPCMQILLGIPFYYPVDTLQRFSNTQIDAAEKSFILGIRKKTQIRVEEKLADIHLRQETVRNLAKEFCAHLLDFPEVFATAEKRAPLHHWIWDGVHPTIAGHFLMYQKWLEVCRENGLLA